MSEMVAPAAFARSIGVSKQAINQAIKKGRIPVYDMTGSIVDHAFVGKKFVRVDEAKAAFVLSRARIDDHSVTEIASELERELSGDDRAVVTTGRSLASAKTESEELKTELLRLRLAKERGELISRDVHLDAMETAGRTIARGIQEIWTYAEEITGLALSGGESAVRAWLKYKSHQLCDDIAKALEQAADGQTDASDDESEPE
ncbi:hypothetical protein [Methylovirgula sp. 4M-Z18]|uniref:hypothetical protein n=1 Tax=Methylovirgula sp. 4M-Z18 TaxID=2293567 RepID=UPI000E2F8C77|nr:hypothetical protein [Methylovirgula sp. 4M-Z18]RFB80413.1 hypothetical protein DYH55_02475 [Methylovirgula sp. 4M-Z18]